jgi:hypothetical protein
MYCAVGGRIQLNCRTFYISQKEGTKKGDAALHILYAVTVLVFFSWKDLSKQRRRNEGSFKFWNTSVRRVKATVRPNLCTVCKVNSRIRPEKNKCKIVYAIEVHSACYASLGVSSFCTSGILSSSQLEILCNWCRFMLTNLYSANTIVDDAFVISYTLRRHDSPCMKYGLGADYGTQGLVALVW